MEMYWRCIGDMMCEKTRISFDTSKHPIRDLYSSIACVITRKTANMAKQIENNGSFLLYLVFLLTFAYNLVITKYLEL